MGVGSFARVYRAEWCGAPVAVKVILHRGGTVEANIEREAFLSTDLRHPNVVQGFQYATRTVDIACGLGEVRQLLFIILEISKPTVACFAEALQISMDAGLLNGCGRFQ